MRTCTSTKRGLSPLLAQLQYTNTNTNPNHTTPHHNMSSNTSIQSGSAEPGKETEEQSLQKKQDEVLSSINSSTWNPTTREPSHQRGRNRPDSAAIDQVLRAILSILSGEPGAPSNSIVSVEQSHVATLSTRRLGQQTTTSAIVNSSAVAQARSLLVPYYPILVYLFKALLKDLEPGKALPWRLELHPRVADAWTSQSDVETTQPLLMTIGHIFCGVWEVFRTCVGGIVALIRVASVG